MDNIFFFYGDEDFLVEKKAKQIKSELVRKNPNLGIENYDNEIDIKQLISNLANIDMFSSNKLFIIKNLKELKKTSKKTNPKDIDLLGKALKNEKNNIVIFIYYGQPDKRTKMFKVISNISNTQEFRPLAFWEEEKMLSWILSIAKEEKKKIAPHAAKLLLDIAGPNLRTMEKEVKKIATYVGEKEWIETSDVESVASQSQMNIFQFQEAFLNKNRIMAIRIFKNLIRYNEDPIGMLGLLSRAYKRLLQLNLLALKGNNIEKIAAYFKTKPYFIRKLMQQSNKYTSLELINTLKMLAAADLKLKVGASPQLIFEGLIVDICS